MEPQHGLVGDISATELPEASLDKKEEALVELRKKAKYSRSKEFAELREYMEARIAHYQSFLPGNVPAEAVPEEERGKYWAVANMVITELRQVIDGYDGANEQVKELDGK